MSSVEHELLVVLGNKENLARFKPFVKEHAVQPETWQIINGLAEYFDKHSAVQDIDWSKFNPWFTLVYKPKLSSDEVLAYRSIFTQLVAHGPVSNESDIVRHFVTMDYAMQIYDAVQTVVDGSNLSAMDDIGKMLEAYADELGVEQKNEFVTTDLAKLLDSVIRNNGVHWRLEDMNVGVGPVHAGDYIVVAARPETGKTSFITSEVSYWLPQVDKTRPALFINNEEQGEKIMFRMVQSTLGLDARTIEANEKTATADYAAALGNADRFLVKHQSDISTAQVESLIRATHPAIVVLNVVDKIHRPRVRGKNDANEVENLRQLHVWARGLASKYDCIVVGVIQADASAEGEKWIRQHQLYGSKTGVQGEADVLITIGRTFDPKEKDYRFIHVPKNKLPGDSNCDPSRKHGYFTVHFDALRGRYETIEFK